MPFNVSSTRQFGPPGNVPQAVFHGLEAARQATRDSVIPLMAGHSICMNAMQQNVAICIYSSISFIWRPDGSYMRQSGDAA
ncbi:protein of unknown function [Paraburkholderia kururiensis]